MSKWRKYPGQPVEPDTKRLAMAKKKKKNKSEAAEELEGFDIKINEFGEIISSKQVDELNEFLNENVEDKKLKNRKSTDDEEEEE